MIEKKCSVGGNVMHAVKKVEKGGMGSGVGIHCW